MGSNQARLGRTHPLHRLDQRMHQRRLRAGFDQLDRGKPGAEQSRVRGTELRSGHQPALHPQPGHALDGQGQHRVQPLFKTEIEQLSGSHTQRQCAKGVYEQPRNQRGKRLRIAILHRQHRTAPLQSKGPGHQLFADPLPAHQPVTQPAGARPLLRVERLPQLARGDPSLLEHQQPQRNPMAIPLLNRGRAFHLPPDRCLNAGPGASRRAVPAALKDRRRAAA